VPSAPTGLASGPGTSHSQLEITWDALTTVEELGGPTDEVTITSYNLEWDQGLGDGSWQELVGETSAFTATTFTTSTQTITAGEVYLVRVRA